MPRRIDAIELEVLRLGRQAAKAADDHTHRGRNHLEDVRQALGRLEGTTELKEELGALLQHLSDFHARMELVFSAQAKKGGSRVTDAELLKDLTGSHGKPTARRRKTSPSSETPTSHPTGR